MKITPFMLVLSSIVVLPIFGVPVQADAERILSVPEAVELCAEANARVPVVQQLRRAKREALKERKRNNKRKQMRETIPEVLAPALCGNGICEEVTCAALGCPEPEGPETCPQDCHS